MFKALRRPDGMGNWDDQPGPDYKEARNWEKREPRQSSTPEVPIPSPSQGAPNASSSPGIPKPFPQIN
ncbi:hypothetical protein GLOIN_2v1771857 [Rhizophagus irregularis DAOM 181602=DAOM 197198]|uniref:Uncharacterized protein n=1 Tax=Rhizophagus irregularis (strain DAOM 181602 / DAOM 197198 / MUCL 43194) TaxID=747089 RepID=A0A2P4Q8Y8_RHIID|nr:hypothetical protein GLOIN_2v1771857 [Rhizophagus irregularis DAOM 181602=DAOM 197198]POG74058.1 hypothetical protein GLOIN_2v1771857 [Rhizophagus irregularis DAOM 181602=DAOM 197198]|eukprot:XP_025180924.1 hypothetical protein GLOIN_2v1771857 [Rhizophagus irregularis DAOM 181602=DAOM 197198]